MLSKPILCLAIAVIFTLAGNAKEIKAIRKRQTFTAVREYYLGFPLNYQRNAGAVPSLLLLTSNTSPVNCIIDVPAIGQTYQATITAANEAFVELPHDLQTFGDTTITNKGIHVQVDSNDIVVIGQNFRRHRADTDGSYLAVPTVDLNIIQYKYFELGMVLGAGRWPAQLLVVGTQANTTMNITLTQPVRTIIDGVNIDLVAGTEYSYNIGQLQTFYVSHSEDLTGTKIITDKPVSLFSGHGCAILPVTAGDCDHMIEQSLPTAMWGTTFYIVPIPRIVDTYYIRVLAANDITEVNFYCNDVEESHTINEGEYIHKELGMLDHCAIHSNKEILVVEYARSRYPSDPAMVLVPATIHYSNQILSSTVSGYQTDLRYIHSVIVIVLAEYFNATMMYFNSGGNSISLDTYQWVPIQANGINEAYYTYINNISTGTFEVFHTNQRALLNTMLFGFSFALHGGYGHAGSLEVRVDDQQEHQSVSGDPHFSIPLPSNEMLCYSIQGYSGLSFNLISNHHMIINALFIDSINDQTEATWIGKLAVILPSGEDDDTTVIFNSIDHKVEIQNKGEFKASAIEQININSHDNITVKGMVKHKGNPRVRVVYSKQAAIFDVTFHSQHLDIDWVVQEKLMENSHGLMGQFMNKDITVDPVKEILIRPGFEAIPVRKDYKW